MLRKILVLVFALSFMADSVEAGCAGARKPIRRSILAVGRTLAPRTRVSTIRVRTRVRSVTRSFTPTANIPATNCPNGVCELQVKVPGISILVGGAQACAQVRANYMARNNFRGHPARSVANWLLFGRFEGVGWSSNPNALHNSIPTCTTSGELVADAVSRGPNGSYRVRIWR